MDGTSISFVDVTRWAGPRWLCETEPNRLRAIGQPVARPMDRTESKLFPNGTKPGTETGSQPGRKADRKKPHPGAYGGKRTGAGSPWAGGNGRGAGKDPGAG
ncbi:hypothetical protein GCM10010247_19590 [Streptomyces calvus]|nr:hypothetical protein GCM10010247_19590 [Streptomyces calvus]